MGIVRLGAEESENTYLFTLKHDRSLARGCGGQGGESVSATLGGFEPEMQEERLCPSSRVLVSHIQKKGGSEAKMDTSRSPHPPMRTMVLGVNPRDISGHTEIPPVSE